MESRELLRKHNIQSPFIHGNIYSNKEGLKVSIKAMCDLFDYSIDEHSKHYKKTTPTEVKKIAGQIVLGLKALHDKGIAHRDLKPENFLVTHQGNVKIADLDTLAELNDKNQVKDRKIPAAGTPSYVGPEFKNPNFHAIDMKAADIFAFGQTLSHIQKTCKNQPKLFENLISKTTQEQPSARLTINMIMQQDIWGETEKEREDFFKNLKKAIQQDETYIVSGDFLVRTELDEEDAFNLMSPTTKKIYFSLERLINKLELVLLPGYRPDYVELRSLKTNINDLNEADKDTPRKLVKLKQNRNHLSGFAFLSFAVLSTLLSTELLLETSLSGVIGEGMLGTALSLYVFPIILVTTTIALCFKAYSNHNSYQEIHQDIQTLEKLTRAVNAKLAEIPQLIRQTSTKPDSKKDVGSHHSKDQLATIEEGQLPTDDVTTTPTRTYSFH